MVARRILATAMLALVACDDPRTEAGDTEVCGIDEGDAPALQLWHYGESLSDGAELRVECGPQGLFMISLVPELSGFVPPGDTIDVDLRMSVPGFDVGPGGWFYEAADVPLYVGCDDARGTGTDFLPFLVPDGILDVETLDGAAGTVWVTVGTGADPLTVERTFTIQAENVGDYFFCYG